MLFLGGLTGYRRTKNPSETHVKKKNLKKFEICLIKKKKVQEDQEFAEKRFSGEKVSKESIKRTFR